MAFTNKSPAPLAKAAGLGIIHQRAADDNRLDNPIFRDLQATQAAFVARRTRLRPELARAVAEIVFGRAA